MTKISLFDNILNINGRLAQLVRASGLHPECREFDPLTVQKKNPKYLQYLGFFFIRAREPVKIRSEAECFHNKPPAMRVVSQCL